MKLPKRAYGSIKKESEKIVDLSSKISPDFDEAVIHSLRKTIKNLRAKLRYIGIADVAFNKYFKKLYRIAGNIRDGQLLLKKLAGTQDTPANFIIWVANYIGISERKWDRIYDESRIRKWQKELATILDKEKNKAEKSFVKRKLRQLNSFGTGYPVTDETIHNGRKIIKDIQYIHDWQEKENMKSVTPIPVKKMSEISDDAGVFMDNFNGMNLLNAYIRKEKKDDARSAGRRLLRIWEKEKNREKDKLVEEFRSLNTIT